MFEHGKPVEGQTNLTIGTTDPSVPPPGAPPPNDYTTPNAHVVEIKAPQNSVDSASVTDEVPAQPEEKAEEPKQERTNMATKTTPKKKAPQRKQKRTPSQDTVISRARRLLVKELNPVAQALGLEKYEEQEFKAKIEELNRAREENMSNSERYETKLKQTEEKVVEMKAKEQTLLAELQKARNELRTEIQSRTNMEIEGEIQAAARKQGFKDTNYGMHLFREHIKGLPEHEEADLDAFFEGLKAKPNMKHFFEETPVPAGPAPVANNQPQETGAPPQPQTPDRAPPKPASPGVGQNQADAMDMNKRDFNSHVRDTYGFSPGMG